MQITFDLTSVLGSNSSLETCPDSCRILRQCLAQLNSARPHNGIAPARNRIDGHCVTFDIPFAFYDGAHDETNAACLRALLNCLIEYNVLLLQRYPRCTPLYQSPVFYKRTSIWDAIPAMYQRGFGDCKSLTAALIAQYRQQGIQCAPVFRFFPPEEPGGIMLFHILVQTPEGYEDPSKAKGMGNEYQRLIF